MLLSSDGVNCEEYKPILNFLENLDESTQVIACSVFDKLKSNYFGNLVRKFHVVAFIIMLL